MLPCQRQHQRGRAEAAEIPLLHHRRLCRGAVRSGDRGPGDFFGSRQHGLPTLQIADLMNDTRTLHAAQSEAAALLAADPLLESPAHALLAAQVQQMFDKAGPMN